MNWFRKKYCVTIADNWTPTRYFWTMQGAYRWAKRFPEAAHFFVHLPFKGWHELKL